MKQWMATISLMALSASGAAESEVSQRHYGINLREAHIEMPDGKRLAADLYEPTGGARDERFPVLLEYLPYRKRDDRGKRYPLFSYFVKRGYVVARVDIRGTGESEGTLVEYEYSEQEQSDGEAVIDWLSKQPFSNGNVGMFGISWGAFNSIHLAMRKPPALKAIIAIQGTDDIYQDDIHFIDGVPPLRLVRGQDGRGELGPGRAGIRRRRAAVPRSLRHEAVDAGSTKSSSETALSGTAPRSTNATNRSRCRRSSSGAGTTATATAFRACSSTSARRQRGSSAPGDTRGRTTATRSR